MILVAGLVVGVIVWKLGLWDFLEPVTGLMQLSVLIIAYFKAVAFLKKNADAMEKRSYEITLGLRIGYDADAHVHGIDKVITAIQQWGGVRLSTGKPTLQYKIALSSLIYPVRNGLASGVAPYMGTEPCASISGELSPKYDKYRTDEEVLETLRNLSLCLGNTFAQKRVYFSYKEIQYAVDI